MVNILRNYRMRIFREKHLENNSCSGFSLIELMVVVAIIAIIAAVAIPGFLKWLPTYRLKAAGQDMYGNFQRAKLMAVQRNLNCAVSFGEDIGGVTFDYSVYIDANGNCIYDAAEEVIASQMLPVGIVFDSSQGAGDGLSFLNNSNGNPTIAFRPNGIPTNSLGGFATGTAYFVNGDGKTLDVVVNVAGGISVN